MLPGRQGFKALPHNRLGRFCHKEEGCFERDAIRSVRDPALRVMMGAGNRRDIMIGLLAMAAVMASDAPDPTNGNGLYELCTGKVDDQLQCVRFIQGALDEYRALVSIKAVAEVVCVPPNAEVGQVVEVVTNRLRDHPEKRQYGSGSLIFGALMEVFPCANRVSR